ncbi:MAG: hypothetical protein ACE5GR_05735 [Nitrosopumilus sp.]
MLQNAQAEDKITYGIFYDMNHTFIPVDESVVNESFEPVNDSFEGFREFTSDLFFQIIDLVYPFFNNLLNGEIF